MLPPYVAHAVFLTIQYYHHRAQRFGLWRYWEGLAGTAALTAALQGVRQAWMASSRQSNSKSNANQGATSCYDGDTAVDASLQVDRKPEETTVESTEDQTSLAPVLNGEISEGVPAASQEQVIQAERGSSCNTAIGTPAGPQTVSINGQGRDGPGDHIQSGNTKAGSSSAEATTARPSSLPDDTPTLGSTPSTRSSPVQVLGFSVGVVDSSTVNVALVSEWPGIGSLHDLLSGKIQLAPGASQEDLLRWTRQVAEGLVHISRRDVGGGLCKAALNVCTSNAFLFLRPRDGIHEGTDTLDVRVRRAV